MTKKERALILGLLAAACAATANGLQDGTINQADAAAILTPVAAAVFLYLSRNLKKLMEPVRRRRRAKETPIVVKDVHPPHR